MDNPNTDTGKGDRPYPPTGEGGGLGAVAGAAIGSAIVEIAIHPRAGENPKYEGSEQVWAGIGFFGGIAVGAAFGVAIVKRWYSNRI